MQTPPDRRRIGRRMKNEEILSLRVHELRPCAHERDVGMCIEVRQLPHKATVEVEIPRVLPGDELIAFRNDPRDTLVQGTFDPDILIQAHEYDAVMHIVGIDCDRWGAAVINDEHIELGALHIDRRQRAIEIALPVVNRNKDGDARHASQPQFRVIRLLGTSIAQVKDG